MITFAANRDVQAEKRSRCYRRSVRDMNRMFVSLRNLYTEFNLRSDGSGSWRFWGAHMLRGALVRGPVTLSDAARELNRADKF